MPEFITEDQYVAVKSAIDNPPPGTTDFHMNEWKGYTARYQEQLKRGGFTDLTPKRTNEAFKRTTENIYNTEKLFKNGLAGIDISNEPDKDFLTGPKTIATRANKKALAEYYSVDITPANYGVLKAKFSAEHFGQNVFDEMEFYNAASPVFIQRAEKQRQSIAQFGAASREYVSGNSKDEAITNLKKNNLYNPEVFNNVWQNYELFGKPMEPKVDAVLDVLERRTKPEFLEKYKVATKKTDEQIQLEDDAVIKDFSETLINIHPDRRFEILQRVGGLAEKRGKASIEDVRNLGNTFVDSAKQMFQGFEGYTRMQVETKLDTPEFKFNVGDVVRSDRLKDITNIQEARQFLIGKISAATSLPTSVGPGAQPAPPPKPNDIVITEEINRLLKDAKADLRSMSSLDRDVMNVQNAVDPFKTDALSTMARVAGTSIGIVGVNALAKFTGLGPFAMMGTAGMYTGLNYDTIRTMYPDMAPDKARNAAATAGILEMGLDQAGLGLLLKIVKGGPVTAASKYLKGLTPENVYGRAGVNAMATYFVESGIELGQESLRPATLALFNKFSKEYQVDIELEKELFKEATPDIFIGMLPLALGGGIISGGKMVFDERKFRTIVANRDAQKMFGFSEDQIDLLQTLVADNKLFSAQDKYNEFRKDIGRADRVREQLQARVVDTVSNVVRTQQTLQFLKDKKLLSNYETETDENGEIRYVIEGKEDRYTEQEFLSELDTRLTTALDAIDKAPDITEDDAAANQESIDSIFSLRGLNETDISQIRGIFGESEAQRRLVFDALLDYDLNTRDGMESYLDKIYNNILPSDRATLGATREEGIKNLSAAILGLNNSIKPEGDTTNTSPNVNDTMIDEIEYVEYDRDSLASEDRRGELADVNAALDEIARKRAGVATDVAIQPVNISNLDTEQSQGIQSVVDLFKDKYNIETIFVKGAKDSQGNFVGPIGVSLGNAIVIDIDQAKGSLLPHLLGHEFSHSLQSTPNVRLWNEMKDIIKEEAIQPGVNENEFVADTVGSRFRDLAFWDKLTTELAKKDQGLASNLIKSVKGFFYTLKRDIVQGTPADITKGLFRDIDKVENSIVATMLKAAKLAPIGGQPQFMEFGNGLNQNPRIQYLAHTLRNQINLAIAEAQRQGGGTEGRKKAKGILVEPQTEEQYLDLVRLRHQAINRKIKNERETGKNIGRTLRGISNRLYKALKENNISAKLLAEAEAANIGGSAYVKGIMPADLTFEDVMTIKNNPAETVMDYIRMFNEVRYKYLNEYVNDGRLEKLFTNAANTPVANSSVTIKSFFEDVKAALFGDVKQVKDVLSETYNMLYTEEGIPKEMNSDAFQLLTTRYSVYKAFGGWAQRESIDEQEQVINQALTWGRLMFDPNINPKDIFVNPVTEELITNSIDEIVTNPNTIQRSSDRKIPLVDGLFSYLDQHITFSSELELLSPSIGTPGSPITANLQVVNDMLIDAYLSIQDAQINIQESVSNRAENIFNMSTNETVRKIYDLLTKKTITVNIKGKEVKLKEGYAGYILNVDEQLIYKEKLDRAGFTDEVLLDIRNQISPEVNELRIKLRDDLIKIIKRNNEKMREGGKPAIDPSEVFFPVQKASLLRSVVDNFDIAFGNGIQPEKVQNALQNENELDFDLKEQNINFISMFNTHAYQTTHKANLEVPINTLKRIFSSQGVREKLEEKIGTEGIQNVFRFIGSLESGGIINTEFGRKQKELINQILSGTARAGLGFNIKTYAVNMMSASNVLLDTSIPTFIKIKAFMGAMSGAYTVDGKSAVGKVIQRRYKAGANALLQVIMGSSQNIEPGIMKDISDKSLKWIGTIDATFLTYSAIAAYNAHYEIGLKQNLQGDALHKFAEKGMVRTITKVAQPNMAATKSYLEQSGHPFFRSIAMYLSEPRKNLGLEYTAFRKGGLKSAEFWDIVVMNHLILGSGAYVLRAFAGSLLGEEDPWDLEDWMLAVLSGPLSGIVMFGSAADMMIKQAYNAIVGAADTDLDKVRVFQPSLAPVRVVTDIMKIKDATDPERTMNERIDAVATFLESGGTAINNPGVAGAGSILDALTDIYKGLFENEFEWKSLTE